MHDAPGVGGIERIGNLDAKLKQLIQLERPSLDATLQRLAFQQLHGDEVLALELVDFVNRADIGVVQGRGGACLALEALNRSRVPGVLVGQELEGNAATQLGVFGAVHHSHTAAAQPIQNFIVGNPLASSGPCHGRCIICCGRG